MNEVISKGHLYIAQPPLYKIKKGKTERYLKNEKEFTEIIIGGGAEGVSIQGKDGKVVTGESITPLLVRVQDVKRALIEIQMERLDQRVIVGLSESGIAFNETSWKRDHIASLLNNIVAAIKARTIQEPVVDIVDDHDGEVAIHVKTRLRGVQYTTTVTRRLWISDKITTIRAVYTDARAQLGEGPYTITATGESKERASAESIEGVSDWVDARGRKGLAITRYKGLGEMNPEQLWETTMDPTNRRLLQVTIDDAIDADQIFTVLMGDEVEPRRKFIEDNALKIRNLDI
jgi:DNA gyrase subunit B